MLTEKSNKKKNVGAKKQLKIWKCTSSNKKKKKKHRTIIGREHGFHADVSYLESTSFPLHTKRRRFKKEKKKEGK